MDICAKGGSIAPSLLIWLKGLFELYVTFSVSKRLTRVEPPDSFMLPQGESVSETDCRNRFTRSVHHADH